MLWKKFAQIYLDQSSNFLLTKDVSRVSENKIKFQQFFIDWLTKYSSETILLYLGGSYLRGITSRFKLSDGILTQDYLLKCDHEEADDRIMFLVNHAVKVDKFSKVVIASSDTDVFMCAPYHFCHWIYSGLDELWVISKKCYSVNVRLVHTIVNNMDNSIDVLPAVHALTGYNTTSKAGTKSAACQWMMKCGYELLHSFGKPETSDQMILFAERFLVKCISKSSERSNFDDIRFETYHKRSFQRDLEKLPSTSSSIHIHVKQAFLQCYLWLYAPFVESIEINSGDYGYELTKDDVSS